MVGAVLVRTGREIGSGWHRQAGGPHAEIEALEDARRRRRRLEGATLYVTLEPCSTQGRTPPCTEALIAARLRRVVVGAVDPNPLHRGRGLRILEAAGIEVTAGMLAEECRDLNRGFNHWIVRRTPWVIAKAAMTLDGKIADSDGHSKWITGPGARRQSMLLRAWADAILVGVGTVLADDPRLTARIRPARRKLWRIVLDSKARTPLSARVIRNNRDCRTVVVTTEAAPRSRVAALRSLATVWVGPARAGQVDLRWLLRRLGREEITSLIVEGGSRVLGSFLARRLIDEVRFFYAPKILASLGSIPAFGGAGATGWGEAGRLERVRWSRVGPDLVLSARVVWRKRTSV
jgi:diaminohydroxyphosphoribosylaminopyrimidine deaminase/5-amino-6-(5-phosphoribosylamino)uracil reductase